jgi:hypothetical protein
MTELRKSFSSAEEEVGIHVPGGQLRPPPDFLEKPVFSKLRVRTATTRHKKQKKQKPWDERFSIPISEQNKQNHPFYKTFFDKKPKELPFNFRFKYA